MMNYNKVPVDYMRGGVQRYIEDGILPGHFLTALFSNDLKEAFNRADIVNTAAMREWVAFMIFEMPHNSQGSEEIVRAWVEAGGINGIEIRGKSGE